MDPSITIIMALALGENQYSPKMIGQAQGFLILAPRGNENLLFLDGVGHDF